MDAKETAEFIGVPYSTLVYWTKGREDTPPLLQVDRGDGRGKPYQFGPPEVMEALMVKELREAGVRLPRIRSAVAEMRRKEGTDWPYRYLAVTPMGVLIWVTDTNQIKDTDGRTYVVDIRQLRGMADKSASEEGVRAREKIEA